MLCVGAPAVLRVQMAESAVHAGVQPGGRGAAVGHAAERQRALPTRHLRGRGHAHPGEEHDPAGQLQPHHAHSAALQPG